MFRINNTHAHQFWQITHRFGAAIYKTINPLESRQFIIVERCVAN